MNHEDDEQMEQYSTFTVFVSLDQEVDLTARSVANVGFFREVLYHMFHADRRQTSSCQLPAARW